MSGYSITIQITDDTYNKITEVIGVINMRSKTETNFTPEDIVKAALYRYLNRLQDKSILEWSEEVVRLLPLDAEFPMKNRIKVYLKKHGLTQTDLAQRSRIPLSTVSAILNNQHQPSIDIFLRIYYALDCPPLNDLLYREP